MTTSGGRSEERNFGERFEALDLAGLGEDRPNDEYAAAGLLAFSRLREGEEPDAIVAELVDVFRRGWGISLDMAARRRLRRFLRGALGSRGLM